MKTKVIEMASLLRGRYSDNWNGSESTSFLIVEFKGFFFNIWNKMENPFCYFVISKDTVRLFSALFQRIWM